MLNFKSSLVEEAVSELINMLLDVEFLSKEDREKVSHVNNANLKSEIPGKG